MTFFQTGLEVWKNYYTKLLAEHRPHFQHINYKPEVVADKCPAITIQKIRNELEVMKNNKAAVQ